MPVSHPQRIVSLIASATEIICALGARNRLAGCSHECDFPQDVRELPQLTEPKFPVEGSSYEIDHRIKAIVQEGLSVYRVSAQGLDEIKPDLIVTQDHCEVCAVSLRDVEDALCQITGSPARIISLHPDCLADIWEGIMEVACALGEPARGEALVAELKGRMAAIEGKAATIAASPGTARPRVASIEWIEPLMSGGNWMPELIAMAGGENLFGEAGKHSPWMTWEDLRRAEPDVIFIQPCGFDIARTLDEMPALTAHEGWRDLKAVCENSIFITDGNRYFNRPGPRLAESLEILAEILYPQSFSFGHEGDGWICYRP